VTRQQIKAIKARQQQNIKRFTDFGFTRLPTGQTVVTSSRPRFNLQEEKILQRLEKGER